MLKVLQTINCRFCFGIPWWTKNVYSDYLTSYIVSMYANPEYKRINNARFLVVAQLKILKKITLDNKNVL
jgi:hypothetical protein